MKAPIAAAILTLLFAGLIAWLSGFNFDHRNADVAWSAVFAVCMAAIAAGLTLLVSMDLS